MLKEDVFTQIQTLLTQATAIKQEIVTHFDLATTAQLAEDAGNLRFFTISKFIIHYKNDIS